MNISEEEKIEKKEYYNAEINFIPANLDLDVWLKKQPLYGFKTFSKDDCASLISALYTVPLYNKSLRTEDDNRRPYYNLHSKMLYKLSKEYSKYIELFISSGIWESDNTFEIGKKSKGYRFTEEYYNQPGKTYLNFKKGRYIEKKEDLIDDVLEGNESPTVKRLIEYFCELKINYGASISKLQEDYNKNRIQTSQYNYIYCAIEKINNSSFFAKQDDYGRLHTNLTNLKKEYRNYISNASGNQLISLDLKNSQPFFSTLLLKPEFWTCEEKEFNIKHLNNNYKSKINNIDSIIMFTNSVAHSEDVIKYKDLVLKGGFYEFFLQELKSNGIDCQDRKEVKKDIFKIFFSENKHLERSKSANVFKGIFPSVYQLFYMIKKTNHNCLATLLQSIESQIFIEGICSKFISSFPETPIYTIHDSIICPTNKAQSLKLMMVDIIKQNVGYRPTLDFEILKPSEN